MLLLVLGGIAIYSSGQETPDLPHAFEAGWKGETVCELLFEDESVRVGRCTFPPGTGHEKHFHRSHFGYVLTTNRMQITDSGWSEVRELTAGTSVPWADTTTAPGEEHQSVDRRSTGEGQMKLPGDF